ncbi:MAG: 5'/3'-nucleotidase SurE [Bacteroidota bacterium]
MKKPLILVTNDDGITAKGIETLVSIARAFGEVVVVAPDSPQSGKGHAVTISDPLRIRPYHGFEGIEAYECSGTPVDCVKLANYVVMKGRKPDLCLSGINHGSNAAVNIIYSGTMSAAMEASIEGVNSIGFSLLDFSADANFAAGRPFVSAIIEQALAQGLGKTNLLNVNIPNLPTSEIKGIKICRQANARWSEEFQEATDPRGNKYYWMTGEFINYDDGTDSDIWALENGYISVVPSQHDLTAYEAIAELQQMETKVAEKFNR